MIQQHSKTFRMSRAGRRYMAFLATFNSGDVNKMKEFVETIFDPFSFTDEFVDEFVTWYRKVYARSGGIRIHRTFLTQDNYIIVIVQSADGRMYLDKMAITDDDPYLITEYNHQEKPL
ncbi:MAG: hypothetical protein ACOCXZ_00310 [Chloroflexota bacterium]